MASRRTRRIINAFALFLGAACVTATAAFAALMAAPGLAFAHSAGDGRITFHAARPLSEDAAREAAADAWAALQDTPFGPPDHGIDVYVAGGGWRGWVYFRPAPMAGGITYPILSRRNVFLSDVDLDAGRLIHDGFVVPEPRDLTYYLVHEITHLRHAEALGPIRMFRSPRWIREGVPDLAALGPAPGDLIARAMAGEELPRLDYGSYPRERVCVTLVLNRPGMDMDRLLRLDAPMDDPRACQQLPPPDSD